MMGTFGGALEARQIDASNGKLIADVSGEVETEENVLVIQRIHVAMRLVAPLRAANGSGKIDMVTLVPKRRLLTVKTTAH
jgi:hypothetical protein